MALGQADKFRVNGKQTYTPFLAEVFIMCAKLPGGSFTKNFKVHNQNHEKLHAAGILFFNGFITRNFAHVMSAQLAWHVQNLFVIKLVEGDWVEDKSQWSFDFI